MFKVLNDTRGHTYGDRILTDISRITMSCIRKTDIYVRWGGDEFIILTYSDKKGALHMAERIRECIEQTNFSEYAESMPEEDIKISISCGVAEFRDNDTMDSIIKRADKALYEAKAGGKKCHSNGTIRKRGDKVMKDGVLTIRKTIPFEKGKTILETARENGIAI